MGCRFLAIEKERYFTRNTEAIVTYLGYHRAGSWQEHCLSRESGIHVLSKPWPDPLDRTLPRVDQKRGFML
ncbi:hypothetical protein EBAPG3_010870 [Nitrosospira lacus]|uniref:Uncharacterized protein n=1 Tax=Nitrosospira lacus TaxID=1288494 RepID=A0A1W6SR41_9PROT|nr:hypothetical protein EBAPG3_010870 [Nitrosospira lacus]